MSNKLSSVFWGLLLIAGGVIALAQTQGYLTDVDPLIWAGAFAVISLVSLVFYFASGIKNWPMLFPVGIFGALALLVFLAEGGADDPAMAAPLFIGIGLPFVVAFILDRTQNWWALIPAGVMAFLTFVLFGVERVDGAWIGSALFFILAVAFGAVYAARKAMWAALVAYIMFILGFLPLLGTSSFPEFAGVLVLFAIALPFVFVYLRSPNERWWALIPAGVLGTLGLLTAIVLLPGVTENQLTERIANTTLYLALAGIFTFIWFRHHKRWAVFFSLLFVALAIFQGILDFQQTWPILVVLAGIYLLVNAFRPRTV